MFRALFAQLALIPCRGAISQLNTREYARKVAHKSKDEPSRIRKYRGESSSGMHRQAEALKAGVAGLDTEDIDLDMLEESESDFMQVHKMYDQFEGEERKAKDLKRLKVIKNKYFKTVMPNLLTWSEKEQIRYLHNQSPNEWTAEKLAESFPATPDVIQKLLQYTWKPADTRRMDRHDASCLRNWRELKEGSLDGISPSLRTHLLKFTDRKIPPRQTIEKTKPNHPPGEFESIVADAETVNETTASYKPVTEEFVLSKREKQVAVRPADPEGFPASVKGHVTLSELQDRLMNISESGHAVNESGRAVLESLKSTLSFDDRNSFPVNDAIIPPSETSMMQTIDQSALSQTTDERRVADYYPQRIKIPKNAFKKGGTYKVKDCYYDDDGQFLYRVPGMY